VAFTIQERDKQIEDELTYKADLKTLTVDGPMNCAREVIQDYLKIT
jgi:hypothetical protein